MSTRRATKQRLTLNESERIRRRLVKHIGVVKRPTEAFAKALGVSRATAKRLLNINPLVGWRRVYAERASAYMGCSSRALCAPPPAVRIPKSIPSWQGLKSRKNALLAVSALVDWVSLVSFNKYRIPIDYKLVQNDIGLPSRLIIWFKPGNVTPIPMFMDDRDKNGRVMLDFVDPGINGFIYYGIPTAAAIIAIIQSLYTKYAKQIRQMDARGRHDAPLSNLEKLRRQRRRQHDSARADTIARNIDDNLAAAAERARRNTGSAGVAGAR